MPPKKTTTKAAPKATTTKKTSAKAAKPKAPTKAAQSSSEKLWESAFTLYYYEALQRIEDDHGLENQYKRTSFMSYSYLLDNTIIEANPQKRFSVSVGAKNQLVTMFGTFVGMIAEVGDKSTIDTIQSELTFDAPLTTTFETEPPTVNVDEALTALCCGQLNMIQIPVDLATEIVTRYLTWIRFLAESYVLFNLDEKSATLSIGGLCGLLRICNVPIPLVAQTKYKAPPKKVKTNSTTDAPGKEAIDNTTVPNESSDDDDGANDGL